MAETKQLKSIKFPGLEDTYTIPQKLSDLEQDIDTGTLKAGDGVDSMIPATTQGATGTSDEKDPTPIASGRSAVALGRYTRAYGKESVVFNYQNVTGRADDPTAAAGQHSFAVNKSNIVLGQSSTAFGNKNTINEYRPDGVNRLDAGFVAGAENIVSNSNQAVFGTYNEEDTKALFILGAGNPTTRKNAYTVDWDGNAVYSGKITVGANPTNDMDLVTKKYLDAKCANLPLVGRKGTGVGAEIFNDYASNEASGQNTHVEGSNNKAYGSHAHAEGYKNIAGEHAHAEGRETQATHYYAHSEGWLTEASGICSHAGGHKTKALHWGSYAEGTNTITTNDYCHVQGKFNDNTSGTNFAHIIGGGSSNTNRKNIYTVDWDGNAVYTGKVTVGANPTEAMDLATKEYIDTLIAALPKIYSGTEEPDNFEGKDGDIYIMYEE